MSNTLKLGDNTPTASYSASKNYSQTFSPNRNNMSSPQRATTSIIHSELDRLRRANAELSREFDKSGSDKTALYEERINIIQAENRNLENLLAAYAKDRELLKQKDAKIADLENRLILVVTENERQASVIDKQRDEIEELKAKLSEMGQVQFLLNEAQSKINRLNPLTRTKEKCFFHLSRKILRHHMRFSFYNEGLNF